MDWLKFIEIGATILITFGAVYIRDVVTKATTRQRVEILEAAFKDLKTELKSIDNTLSATNQSLASLNATVKGLAHWLQRTEDRLNNL